jgi:hypothetical protein
MRWSSGIEQAALNFNFGESIAPEGIGSESEEFIQWQTGGEAYAFRRSYVVRRDRLILGLSERDVTVSLILLNYLPADPVKRRLLVHPGYSEQCPNHLAAFKYQDGRGAEVVGTCLGPVFGGAVGGSEWQVGAGAELDS